MKVHLVGSSGTFPTTGNPAAGFILEHGSTRIWSDAGPGTFMSLPVEPDLIDAVVLSHQHPDHCADILIAFHAWTFRPNPRTGIPVYAPPSLWKLVTGFLGTDPECFDFHPVTGGEKTSIGDIDVEFVAMDHPVPTVGTRWEASNRTLFYTADTGPDGGWTERARDVHVMLSEASIQGDYKEFSQHLTAREAGSIARELGAERLVLTHIPPYYDKSISIAEAEETYGKPVALAVPGASFDI